MKYRYIFLLVSLIINFSGCVTAPLVTPPKPAGIPGVYHRVEKGETLWRISKNYDVDLDEIVRINHISDAANIEVNQLIFIPHRKKQRAFSYVSSKEEDFIWPLKGGVITTFNQVLNNMINKGINIQPYNNLEVVASRSGKIIFYSPNFKGFGKTIIIEHGDGFLTVYARNSEVFIKTGDNVHRGATIAKAGYAGRDKRTYLHFEIRKGHISQNPYFYLPR